MNFSVYFKSSHYNRLDFQSAALSSPVLFLTLSQGRPSDSEDGCEVKKATKSSRGTGESGAVQQAFQAFPLSPLPPPASLVFIFSRSSLLRRIRRMYRKNNSCHPVTVEWFSKQILVNFEILKLSIHPSLTHYGTQIYCFEKTTFFPKNQRLKWNLTSKHAAYKTSALIIWACRPLLETAPAARHPYYCKVSTTNKQKQHIRKLVG